MTDPRPIDTKALRKSRLKLLLIVLVFMAPILAAGVLTLSGWQPVGKGNGLPVSPQRNLVNESVRVDLAGGGTYAWRDSKPRMTLVALANGPCEEHCVDVLTKMAAARLTLNDKRPRLRLLYLGEPPDHARGMHRWWQIGRDPTGALAAFRPASRGQVSALLVESNGTALSYYPAGFDPTGLRKDMKKVIR